MVDLLTSEKPGEAKKKPTPRKGGKALPSEWARRDKLFCYRGAMHLAGINLTEKVAEADFVAAIKEHGADKRYATAKVLGGKSKKQQGGET